MSIKLGDKITFIPCAFIEIQEQKGQSNSWGAMGQMMERKVTATVDFIHAEHGWFRARYTVNGHVLYECFRQAGASGDTRYRFKKIK